MKTKIETKPKRIKRVFGSADQVLHLWANQVQDSARCANVFFEGKRVYSYGYHYLLGELVTAKNGASVAVVNRNRYSATTNKHRSWAWSSVAHIPRVRSSDGTLNTGLVEEQTEIVDYLMGWFSDRSFYIDVLPTLFMKYELDPFNNTCRAVGRRDLCVELTDDFKKLMKAHARLMIRRRKALAAEKLTPEYIAKRDARLEREAKLMREKHRLEIHAWLAGGPITAAVRSLDPQIIRLNGDRVETSRGAVVPLADAQKLLRALNAGKNMVGHDIGGFKVLSSGGATVRIGCHSLSLAQCREVLKQTDHPEFTVISGGAS